MSRTGDSSALPPGTTSLLLRLDVTDVASVREWLQEWLRIYVFSAQSTLSVPLSTDIDGAGALLYFYASQGDVRGMLTLSAEREHCDDGEGNRRAILVRATSASRFINPAGMFTATLPGERRIIRNLFSDMGKAFPGLVHVVYKPPYIRLKRSDVASSAGAGAVPVTVFIGEVRGAGSVENVIDFLQSWCTEVQFGARAGLRTSMFGNARLPPMSTEVMEGGLRIRSVVEVEPKLVGNQGSRSCELLVTVKRPQKGNVYSKNHDPEGLRQHPRRRSETAEREPWDSNKILVIASATHPEEIGTRSILQRLSQDLLSEFPKSRFHSPQK